MECYSPVTIIPIINGERNAPFEVRCGKCLACQMAYSSEWAIRCVLESRLHERSTCVTLTYDDYHLPEDGQLKRKDVQDFLKRLRKKYVCRYFGCGEYGERKNRPHYHLVLFGIDFDDKRYFKRSKNNESVYVSAELSRLWKNGWATIGEANKKAAFYAAKYLSKFRESIQEHSVKPFTMMSLKPSIGIEGVTFEEMERGYFYFEGRRVPVPRSFYQSYKRRGVEFLELKAHRLELVCERDPYDKEKLIENSYKKCQEILDKLRK